MERLTEPGYEYHSCDFMDEGLHIDMNRLSKYEDTGLTPQQIQELKERDTAKYLKIEQRGDVLRYYCPCCGAFFYQHVKGKLPVRMRRDHHCTCGQRIKHEIDD